MSKSEGAAGSPHADVRHDGPCQETDHLERCDAIIRHLARELVEIRRQHATDLDARQGQLAALEEQLAQLTNAEAQRVELQHQLQAVYDSETWKVGAALLWLPKKLRGIRQAP